MLAALIIVPLIFPEALPQRWLTVPLSVPAAPRKPDPIPAQQTATAAQSVRALSVLNMSAPRTIPDFINQAPILADAAMARPLSIDMPSTGIPGADVFRGNTATVQPAPKPKAPIAISQGVAAGMLVQKTVPRYPPLAIAMRQQGTVVLRAVISKEGAIEKLRVESGPAILQQAAIDAVREWRTARSCSMAVPSKWKPPSTSSSRSIDDHRLWAAPASACTAHLRRFA